MENQNSDSEKKIPVVLPNINIPYIIGKNLTRITSPTKIMAHRVAEK